MRKKLLICLSAVSVAACIALTVLTLYAGFEKSYYLMAVLIIAFAILPFFAYFEGRRIKTIEIVALSMMISVAVIGRLIFSFVPEVKPMAAFVVVTGIAFGANAGFIAGAVSIFVSNFFLGQGVFTPFQMLGMGLVGFIAGLVFHARPGRTRRWSVALVGGASVLIVYGFIVDVCAVLTMATELTWAFALSIFGTGFWFNVVHAATTALVLLLIEKPMNDKFERLRIKYGVFDA